MTHASSHALQQRFVRGKQLLDQGRHDEAATLFRALALDAPKNPSVHALYAMTQLHRNELESARTHINKAIRLSPRDARLRRELGRVEARR